MCRWESVTCTAGSRLSCVQKQVLDLNVLTAAVLKREVVDKQMDRETNDKELSEAWERSQAESRFGLQGSNISAGKKS